MIDYVSSIVLLVTIMVWYSQWVLPSNEVRPYLVEIPDPLFKFLPVYDTSWPVAMCLWSTTLLFVVHGNQWNKMEATWTFILLMLTRSLILYLHPFRGHHTMKPLRDVILERFIPVEKPMLHDLSVSGHTSTIVAMGLILHSYAWFCWIAAALTTAFLVLSRVHYTADCVIAPMFSFFCYHASDEAFRVWRRWMPGWMKVLVVMAFWWPVLRSKCGFMRHTAA